MFGILLLPLFIMLFALRVAFELTRGLLWACWQVIACLIAAALIFGVAWLLYEGFSQ